MRFPYCLPFHIVLELLLTMGRTRGSREHERKLDVLAPRHFSIGPYFAATRQIGPREVVIEDTHYLIGGHHPLRTNLKEPPPAFDMRHCRAILTLLSFRDPEKPPTQLITFPMNEFCRRYAHSSGGRYMRDIKNILGEVADSYIQVTDLKTKVAFSYRIIERVEIRGPIIKRRDAKLAKSQQTEFNYNSCTLSPEFCGILGEIVELQHVKLSVLTKIRSPLGQAIYLYIPSRAAHHSEDEPFEISLTKLFEQVSLPVPRHKSKRKQVLTKRAEIGNSILQQLDNKETLTGRFRVKLNETTNGADWKLQCWVEKDNKKRPLGSTKLEAVYLASGRSADQLRALLSKISPLESHEEELLEKANVAIEPNRRFFEKAKAMLKPSKFTELLHEAKGDEQEGRVATKNPTARLIYRTVEAIPEFARP